MKIKKLTAIFILICMLISLCACGLAGERIYVALDSMPETLDAQVAGSDSELLITRNIYEGLFRQNDKGEVVPAAVQSYTFDALTYTFELKENLKWSDGKPLVADDFVFGIKRALLPETKAPFARLLYSISGAVEAHIGAGSIDNLGVTAINDKTLQIRLSYDDKNFIKTLSMPVAMPCRQSFFNDSTGKYGLEKEWVLSNGTYKIARWNKEDNGIRLYINEEYKGDFKVKNNGIFIAKDKQKTVAEKLVSGEADIALVPSKYLEDINRDGIKTKSVENICWVLSIGEDFNVNIRRALCSCISRDIYKEKLSSGFNVATSFFPNCLGNINAAFNLEYNPAGAIDIISEEIKESKNKRFPQTTLVYYESLPLRPAITTIVGDWQKNLSAFINIKSTDKSLEDELKTHSLPLSVFPVKADSTLEEYIYKLGENYYSGYNLVPIAYEDTTVGYNGNISGVSINATGGYIDFSYIVKK